MSEKTDEKYFVWKQRSDVMPFPMDYPLDDLDKLWNQNRGRIAKYITKYGVFQDFYMWMRYANGKKLNEETYKEKGVPAELEPFFHSYFTEICSFRGRTNKNKIPEFENLFCKKLHEDAMRLEHEYDLSNKASNDDDGASAQLPEHGTIQKPNDLYWYRRLYENIGFQENISASYWEREYDYRAELLRELSLQLPLEMQVAQLQKLIASMDAQIASMLYLIFGEKKNKATNKKTSFLATFPQELIGQLRNRVVKSNEAANRVGYRVHDFTIATEVCGETMEKSLEKYFDDIRSNTNTKATREAVRPYYLQDICKIPEQSEFQKVCIQLRKYIDTYVDYEKTQEERECYIVRRCKVYYEPFFSLSATPIGHLQPGYDRSTGAEIVIDELISALYSDFYRKYNHEINTICNINRDVERYCNIINKWADEAEQGGRAKEDIVSHCTQRYFSVIRSMCNDHILENPSILESRLSPKDIAVLSQTIVEQCKSACYEFNRSECEWMNEDTLQKWWMRYNEICFGSDQSIPLAGTSKEDIHLYTALFICRVRAECRITQATTSKVYSIFVEHLRKRKGGMHNASHQKRNPKQAAEK